MSLSTFSIFYFDFDIDREKYIISFDEGGPELQAEVQIGSYTPTDLATAVQDALNVAGALTYTVAFNRTSRSFTISATGVFSLLVSSGSSAVSAFPVIGFTGSDRTGSASYTGDESGNAYEPQFILQDHISSDNYRELVNPTVNEAADGSVEVVRFGTRLFVQFNIKWATNKSSDGKIIKDNSTGVEDLQTFMQYLIQKKPVEYMPDIDSRNTFQSLILESNDFNQNGTGYRLKELYDQGLPFYFETGILKMRVV